MTGYTGIIRGEKLLNLTKFINADLINEMKSWTEDDYNNFKDVTFEALDEEEGVLRITHQGQLQTTNVFGSLTTYGTVGTLDITFNYDTDIYEEVVCTVDKYGSEWRINSVGDYSSIPYAYFTGALSFAVYGKRKDSGAIDRLSTGTSGWTFGGQYSDGSLHNNVPNLFCIGNLTRAKQEFGKNFKLFRTESGARAYLETGDDSDIVGDKTEPEEDVPKDRMTTLYYRSMVYNHPYNAGPDDIDRIGPSDIYVDIRYKTNAGEALANPRDAVIGYVVDGGEPNDMARFGNIIWIRGRGEAEILKVKTENTNGHTTTFNTLPDFVNTAGFYGPFIDGLNIYQDKHTTNMQVFANRNDALAWRNGDDSIKPIIRGGSNKFDGTGVIGDTIEYNESHNMIGGGMSSCWVLDEAGLADLAPVFTMGITSREMVNPDDPNEGYLVNQTSATLRALAMYGEPIDMVCDLFWLPFDPTEFYAYNATPLQVSKTAIESIVPMSKVLGPAGQAIWATASTSNPELVRLKSAITNGLSSIASNTNVTVRENPQQ